MAIKHKCISPSIHNKTKMISVIENNYNVYTIIHAIPLLRNISKYALNYCPEITEPPPWSK